MEDNSIKKYMDSLLEAFEPTASQNEATHQFSTDEIYDAIKSLNPGAELSVNDIYNAMLEAGFVFKPRRGTAGLDFRWLLIAKSE